MSYEIESFQHGFRVVEQGPKGHLKIIDQFTGKHGPMRDRAYDNAKRLRDAIVTQQAA